MLLKVMLIILVGRNEDPEKANAFRRAERQRDALRKQKSRATGDLAFVVLMCFSVSDF